MVIAAAALAMVGASGCALCVVGAAAGAGAGTVSYVGNELRVTREVGVEGVWEAARAGMKDMEFAILLKETRKDATGCVVQGRNAKDQKVRIEALRLSDRMTEIRVRVGFFSTLENRQASQLLYEGMSKHLP